jgi:hypothetical protein
MFPNIGSVLCPLSCHCEYTNILLVCDWDDIRSGEQISGCNGKQL